MAEEIEINRPGAGKKEDNPATHRGPLRCPFTRHSLGASRVNLSAFAFAQVCLAMCACT